MSYFAEIDNNGVVLRVIVAEQAFIDSGAVGDPANWIETSKEDGGLKKNAATKGGTYDIVRDEFIPAKIYDSWILDTDTLKWKAPVDKPKSADVYTWNESTLNWEIDSVMSAKIEMK